MVKMHDAGKKIPTSSSRPISYKPKTKIYPYLNLDCQQAPMLEGKEVGDVVTMVVKGKVTSHSMSSSEHHSRDDYTIEINSIGIQE